jgi:hypothetical protein
MPETITVWLDDQIGITGQYLWFRKSDGTLLNTGGDALTETPASSGQFAAALAESRTGLGTLRVVVTSSSDPADAALAGWLAEDATLVSEEFPGASGGLTTEQENTLNGIATTLAGASAIEATGRVVGGDVSAYIGDDFRVRSNTQLEIPVADVGGALYTKLNVITAANLSFSASRPNKGPGEITGTVSSIVQDSATQFHLVVEIIECGSGLRPDDYTYQIEQSQTHSSEIDTFVELEGTLTLKAKS